MQARTWRRQAWVRLAYRVLVYMHYQFLLLLAPGVRSAVERQWWSESEEERSHPPRSSQGDRDARKEREERSPPTAKEAVITSLPSHPPVKAERCSCKDKPFAARLQVRDPDGKFFYRCAKRECNIFMWEVIPEVKGHWPYMLGLELNRSSGTWQREVASCCHPLEELVAMGGTKPSLQCGLCGGRWERGPCGQRLVGSKERKKFLAAAASRSIVEVLGVFGKPTEEEVRPS